MNLTHALLRLLVFPGLLFAVPVGWFFVWMERKVVAKAQSRIGPPFMQPLFDFVKLMGKSMPPRPPGDSALMRIWPILSVAALLGALALLPVLPHSGGFSGDLVLLVGLLELPSIFLIAAGFSSRSLFGEIGAAREAVLSIAYNVVFILAIVALGVSQNTFRLEDLTQGSPSPLRWIGIIGILICIPAKLHLNPFSQPDAEQEIYAGPLTEYAGPELACWELAHSLEWVALTGLVACLIVPQTGVWYVDPLLLAAVSCAIVLALAGLAAATARLTIDDSVRFYWRCGFATAVLIACAALFMRRSL